MANDIAAWLEDLGLGKYAGTFAENEVTLAALPYLTDQDLKEIGVGLGARRIILAAVARATESPADQAAGAKASVPSAEPERRQVSIMFCDLVGSTELSQRLDPEDLREVMRQYHDAVAAAVSRYEGHVAKLLGDGVLAYFGWPRAHEDQAVRAVHAALEAVAGVEDLMPDGGEGLRARAGVATGQVVIGDVVGDSSAEAGAVAGQTPNLAARLQALAQPGTVIIGPNTRRLTGQAFALRDEGTHRLKGFTDPVRAWRVVGPSKVGSRFEATHGAALTGFVGRAGEIALLRDRWERAKGGEGQAVLISGEAGVGKSRILQEFREQLETEPRNSLHYQGSPHRINAAFYPIIEQLHRAAEFREEDTVEEKLDKLERYLGSPDDGAPDAPALMAALLSLPTRRYPPLNMTPQRQKLQTIALLVARLETLSATAPALLLVEDVHWIDASTLETFDAMIDRVPDLPVLIVMTHRPEFEPRWTGYGHVTHHSLNRLSREDGRALAERVSGGKALPEAVLAQILEHTDGVPLFVEELTKTVLEAGFLTEMNGRYVLDGPLPPLAVPSTLHDSLMARLDRLASVREVVQAAACIGREFRPELLTAVVSVDRAALDEALSQLVEAQLVFRRSAVEGTSYLFKHALVQDAAYESLLMSKRRQLHARLAETIEGSEEAEPLVLGRHYAAAGLAERAAAAYLAAGRRLLESSALPEAAGALELGLEQVDAIAASTRRDRLELDLRVALGAARMAQSGWAHPSVADALEPAFPFAISFGDQEAIGSILWGLWVHYQTRTDFPRAHEWLSELEAVAGKNQASDLPLVYDMSAGCQYFWEADYTRALGHTDHLKTIYNSGRHSRIVSLTNHDPLVFSQHWAGSLAEWIRGYPERSVERLDEALRLARRIGHPFNLVFALTAGATSLIYLDQSDRLLEHCDEAEAVAVEGALGPFSENVNVMQWRGGAYVQRGEYERGYALAQQGNDFWTNSGGRICTAMFRSWVVRGLQGLGRTDEAIRLNRENIAHCRQTGDCYMEPECLRLKGELLLRGEAPDRAAAEAALREGLSLARAHGARSWELRAATSLARLLQSDGRSAEARAVLTPVYAWFTEGLATSDLKQAKALLETLA